MANDDDQIIKFGSTFSTYDKAEQAIQVFAEEQFIVLWKREARTIQASKVKRFINEELIYYELKYACVHGGKHFVTTSKGLRDSSTFRKECPFFIRLRASKDGKNLEITAINNEHNHEILKEQRSTHPAKRKMPKDFRNMPPDLLALKAKKKQLIKEKVKATGKPKTSKSYAQKRSEILAITNNLADFVAQSSNVTFERRKQLLLDLKHFWQDNANVKIMPTSEVLTNEEALGEIEPSVTVVGPVVTAESKDIDYNILIPNVTLEEMDSTQEREISCDKNAKEIPFLSSVSDASD